MSNQEEWVDASHYVSGDTVRCFVGAPTRTGRWAVFFSRTECGTEGLLHHENCRDYGAPRIWTFVPNGLPMSAYVLSE